MKKISLSYLLSMLFVLSISGRSLAAQGTDEMSDRAKMSLVGNTASVTQRLYKAKKVSGDEIQIGSVIDDKEENYSAAFTEEGNLLYVDFLQPDGSVSSRISNIYQKSLLSASYTTSPANDTLSHTLYTYDSEGHKASETFYYEGFLEYKHRYDYAGDRLDSLFIYDQNGQVEEVHAYKYKNSSKPTTEKRRRYTTGEILKYEYEYDTDGNKTKEVWYNKKGKPANKWVFEHDINGNILTDKWYDNESLVEKWSYEYDENNNKVKRVFVRHGAIKSVYIYRYQYDENKNWLRKISFKKAKNGYKPENIWVRKITYHSPR